MSDEKTTVSTNQILLQPGTLWTRVKEVTQHAMECGALVSIPTDYEFVEQNGVNFLVRILANLIRKDEAKKKQEKQSATTGKDFNPFLPYEQDLWVADISRTHACILNKFNVVDYHLLIITREFEEQESLLSLQDFTAMWACLGEYDGLAFYNGGKIAGASQRHKHLQLVPQALAPTTVQLPIKSLLAEAKLLNAKFPNAVGTIPGFPFVNAFTWLNSSQTAEAILEQYNNLLVSLNIKADQCNKQSAPYNLLVTREWMLLVPRQHESFESISVNSLGFAGSLFVRDDKQMRILKKHGPMNLLRNVGFSNSLK
jgi:sulfate adenylyltransferase (ADP) / ATP adenylyltransferase